MSLRKKLAIGFLASTLGMSSVALAAGKGASNANRTIDVIGPIVEINTDARYVTVKDTYSGKLYTFHVANGSKVNSLNTLAHYLSFERLQEGIVLNLQVQSPDSENIQAKAR